MRVTLTTIAAAFSLFGTSATAATLLAQGVVEEQSGLDIYLPESPATSNRYRLTVRFSEPASHINFVRTEGLEYYQWFDYGEGFTGWYYDGVSWFVDEVFWFAGGPVQLMEQTWDPGPQMQLTVLSERLFQITVEPLTPITRSFTPGEDDTQYRGSLPTELFAFAPVGARYRIYATALPEPATWSLLIAGFGLAGVALRRSRRTALESDARRFGRLADLGERSAGTAAPGR